MAECRRFFIEGRVQGVFYRSNTEKKAKNLGLTGWVRNTEDGGVECVACGIPEDLDVFEKWLWKGPLAAKVKSVKRTNIEFQDHHDFEILY